jgi:hypothetical protein
LLDEIINDGKEIVNKKSIIIKTPPKIENDFPREIIETSQNISQVKEINVVCEQKIIEPISITNQYYGFNDMKTFIFMLL